MRIVCPKCSAQYEVDARLFPEEGRAVQCAQCDARWTQYRVEDEPPAPEPEPEPETPSPSSALPEEERRALRQAVEEEVSIRNAAPAEPAAPPAPEEPEDATLEAAIASAVAPQRRTFRQSDGTPEPEPVREETEEEMIKSLRRQLSEADDDFDDEYEEERRPSGRRDLNRAIDMAGINIEDEEDEEDEDSYEPRGGHAGSVNQSDLAAALKEYEREVGPRGGGRWGFLTAVFLFLIGTGVYFAQGEISKAFPAAEPAISTYASGIDSARAVVFDLYQGARGLIEGAASEKSASSQ